MVVHADRMRANLELTHGALFSQRGCSRSSSSGMTRDDAYRIVQEDAQRAWDTGTPFASCSPRATRASTSTRSSTPGLHALRAEIVGRLDAIAGGNRPDGPSSPCSAGRDGSSVDRRAQGKPAERLPSV